jgi:hypothetical protein
MPSVRKAYRGYRITCAVQSDDPLRVRELLAADPHVDAVLLTPEWHCRFDPAKRFLARSGLEGRGEYLEFLLPAWGDAARFAVTRPWTPRLEPADDAVATRLRDRYLHGQPFLVIHAASRRHKTPDWEWPGYAELIEQLAHRTGRPIVVVGDTVPLRPSRGTVLDLTRNLRLGIGLRAMLALVLQAELVLGGDSGFEVAPWLAGRRVISLVPERHLRRGYRVDLDGQTLVATVDQWLPPTPGCGGRQVVLPLETTSVEEVLARVAGMGLLGPGPARPLASPARARRPCPVGAPALLRHAVPDLVRPLIGVLGPALLRLRGRPAPRSPARATERSSPGRTEVAVPQGRASREVDTPRPAGE